MGQNYYEDMKQRASKILGDKGKIPPEKGDMQKAYDDIVKVAADFKKARDALEETIVEVQKATEIWIVIAKQNKTVLSKDSFGLDEKDKEDGKKIKEAQTFFSSSLEAGIKTFVQHENVITELDKHCIEMGKYKSPKI